MYGAISHPVRLGDRAGADALQVMVSSKDDWSRSLERTTLLLFWSLRPFFVIPAEAGIQRERMNPNID